MNLFIYYLFIIFGGGGWGGQTVHWNSELEMPGLRNPRVQMATGHDILVMFWEREDYVHGDATWKQANWSKLTRCVLNTHCSKAAEVASSFVQVASSTNQKAIKNFFLIFFSYKKSNFTFFLFVQMWCFHTREVLMLFFFY